MNSAGKVVGYLDHKEKYRPMTFSDLLSIFEFHKESRPDKRAIEWLKSVGKLATGVAVFVTTGAQLDYTRAVDIFTGIFTPELEKNLLWDVNMHLKNLQTRSLKEIEELPAKSAKDGVVFFPRGPIFGIDPQMPVYISEIRPDAVYVDATVIDKLESAPSTPQQ